MTNLTHEQLVEKVACSIFKSIGAEDPYKRVRGGKPAWTLWEGMARAAIAAVREAIKEPTEAMKAALATQSSDQGAEGDWRAMLAASPLNPEGK